MSFFDFPATQPPPASTITASVSASRPASATKQAARNKQPASAKPASHKTTPKNNKTQMSLEALDDLMESKFAYSTENGDQIQVAQDDSSLNDLTFGDAETPVADFIFGNQPQQELQKVVTSVDGHETRSNDGRQAKNQKLQPQSEHQVQVNRGMNMMHTQQLDTRALTPQQLDPRFRNDTTTTQQPDPRLRNNTQTQQQAESRGSASMQRQCDPRMNPNLASMSGQYDPRMNQNLASMSGQYDPRMNQNLSSMPGQNDPRMNQNPGGMPGQQDLRMISNPGSLIGQYDPRLNSNHNSRPGQQDLRINPNPSMMMGQYDPRMNSNLSSMPGQQDPRMNPNLSSIPGQYDPRMNPNLSSIPGQQDPRMNPISMSGQYDLRMSPNHSSVPGQYDPRVHPNILNGQYDPRLLQNGSNHTMGPMYNGYMNQMQPPPNQFAYALQKSPQTAPQQSYSLEEVEASMRASSLTQTQGVIPMQLNSQDKDQNHDHKRIAQRTFTEVSVGSQDGTADIMHAQIETISVVPHVDTAFLKDTAFQNLDQPCNALDKKKKREKKLAQQSEDSSLKIVDLKEETTEPARMPKVIKILKRPTEKNEVVSIEFANLESLDENITSDIPAPIFESNPEEFPKLGGLPSEKTKVLASAPTTSEPKQKSIENSRQNQKQRRLVEPVATNFFVAPDEVEDDDKAHLPRMQKYAGLMRKFEKELIAKIQIASLVSDDPFTDDYYFQIHQLKKSNTDDSVGEDGIVSDYRKNWQRSLLKSLSGSNPTRGNSKSVSDQMRKQMKRLIEGRKQKPARQGIISIEGALGTISSNTARNPKRAFSAKLTISPPINASLAVSEKPAARGLMISIEKVFDSVMDIEQTKLQEPKDKNQEWELKIVAQKAKLIESLGLLLKIPLTEPHLFLSIFNYPKGVKIISRALPQLSNEQILSAYSLMLTRLECLSVCSIPLNKPTEAVNVFMNSVIPSVVAVINESDMPVINGLMRILLERHNIVWLAQNRIGLAILTALLNRAEILKSGSGDREAPSEQDLTLWNEIYNFVFSSLQTQFASLFPPIISSADELYLWQFLSAMAVGAIGIDHQRVLVTEVRENVIKTSKTGDSFALDNVNLFLNALGLGIDATQLAAMG